MSGKLRPMIGTDDGAVPRCFKSSADASLTHTHTQAVLLCFAPLCLSNSFHDNKWISLQHSTHDLGSGKFYRPALLFIFSPPLYVFQSHSLNQIKLIWPVPQVEFQCVDGYGMLTHQCLKPLNLYYVVWLEIIFPLLILFTAAICCTVYWT